MVDSRKNIFDIINSKHPINSEIKNIKALFQDVKTINNLYGHGWSLEDFAAKYFLCWKGRGTYILLRDLKDALGINAHFFEFISEKNAVLYLEYVINIQKFSVDMYRLHQKNLDEYKFNQAIYDALIENISQLLSQINYRAVLKDEGMIVLVPDKPEVNEVVALIDDKSTQLAILEYNHVRNRNNLDEKRKSLLILAHDFDGKKAQLLENDAWKQLAKDLGFMFNNLNIRHNNTDSVKEKLSDSEMILWYDKTYQLYLTAILALEYRSDFKPDIEYLKTQLKK